jgi:ubiquinone/menaquinone biosynthesis C-methylase UbiE
MTHGATEQRSLEEASRLLPAALVHANAVIAWIKAVHPLPNNGRVLDVGAAQGGFAIACAQLGYHVIGVEPWHEARQTARALAQQQGIDIEMVDGVAEALPVPSESIDLVYAKSVVEHVDDASAMFREVYRVLRPGGVFWFSTASSMCPIQGEIRGFPAFGWYPDFLKIRIMTWARDNRPDLVGHTTRPAYHWFTPWKARRMLREVGFDAVVDRWDLRQPSEGGRFYRMALACARVNAATKAMADIVVPDCSYAAVKK